MPDNVSRQTWELAGQGQYLQVSKDAAGYIEVRVLDKGGRDLAVVSTAGANLVVRIVEPHQLSRGEQPFLWRRGP